MRFKFILAAMLIAVMALATSALAVDYLRGITYWDVAEIKGITVGEFHPIPWRFQSEDTNAGVGTVSVDDADVGWSGRWEEIRCNTIYCDMVREGTSESWYIKFINPHWFIAYRKFDEGGIEHYPLFRLGKLSGVPYWD